MKNRETTFFKRSQRTLLDLFLLTFVVIPLVLRRISIDLSFVHLNRFRRCDLDHKIEFHVFLYKSDYNQPLCLRLGPNRRQIFGRLIDELYVFSKQKKEKNVFFPLCHLKIRVFTLTMPR